MHINCICCGHRFDLGRSYDDYEGLVRCSTCRGLLDVKTADGQVRSVRPAAPASPAPLQFDRPATASPEHGPAPTAAPALRPAA